MMNNPYQELVHMEEEMGVEEADKAKKVEEEDPEMHGLSEYERIRLRNIRQRKALFAELGIQDAKEKAQEAAGMAEPALQEPRRGPRREAIKGAAEPVRNSLRLAGSKVPEIHCFS
jgi:hypothetical protein